jgi:hypothetical protein
MKPIVLYTGLFLAMVIFQSCENIWDHCIDGNGNRISVTRTPGSFDQIQVNGDFKVQIDTGSQTFVTVEADENLMDLIITHVSGDKLIIESRSGHCLNPTHPIEITVSVPQLHRFTLNGSGYVYCYGLATDELVMHLAGSGQMDCYELEASSVEIVIEGSGLVNSNLYAENMVARIEGSGEARLSGATVNSDLKVIGSGRIKADQMNTDVCIAYISGSGIIDANVNNTLDVTIIGSGIVYYQGNPVVKTFISGSGRVVKQ